MRFNRKVASVVVTVATLIGGAGIAEAATSTPGATQPAGDVHACVNANGGVAFLQFRPANYGQCGDGNSPWVWARTDGSTTTAPAPTTFGVGQIQIDRGTGATTWAQYDAAELGAPGGDQASGTFRFTCTNATSGCNVSLKAYSTASGWTVYPRILLEKEDNTTGDKLTCEYADGVNNEVGSETGFSADLPSSAAPETLGIGTTADCGGSQTGTQPDGVSSINVPGSTGQGTHYDVFTTLTFAKAS